MDAIDQLKQDIAYEFTGYPTLYWIVPLIQIIDSKLILEQLKKYDKKLDFETVKKEFKVLVCSFDLDYYCDSKLQQKLFTMFQSTHNKIMSVEK